MDTIEKRRRDGKAHGMFPDMPDPYPSRFPLSGRDQRIYRVLRLLYGQQKYMYDEKVNSVADGMARTEHISWGNFNESKDLELQVRAYRKTHGRWPELLLADRAYLNRENRKWLKGNGIRTVGVPLGRPPKEELTAYQKRRRKRERNQRNHIEGKFGRGKNAYGLGNIQAKRRDTSEGWTGAVFFVMNLVSLAKIADLYAVFCALFRKWSRSGPFFDHVSEVVRANFGPVGNRYRNIPEIGAV